MKKLLMLAAIFPAVFLQFACQKEKIARNTSCTNCLPTVSNKPPAAYAGADQQISLPVDSIILNGAGADDDGTVVTYFWEKLSGPTATIDSAGRPQTSVNNMVQGVYYFELTVTDNLGATGKDQVRINVLKADEPIYSNWFGLDTSATAGAVYYDSSYFISSHSTFPNLDSYDERNTKQIIFTKLIVAGVADYKIHNNPLQVVIQLPFESSPFIFDGHWDITYHSHGGTFFYQELYNTYSASSLGKVAFIKAAELLISYEYRCFIIPNSIYNSLNINWNNYLEVVAALNVTP